MTSAKKRPRKHFWLALVRFQERIGHHIHGLQHLWSYDLVEYISVLRGGFSGLSSN
jgi:hypothetical protein